MSIVYVLDYQGREDFLTWKFVWWFGVSCCKCELEGKPIHVKREAAHTIYARVTCIEARGVHRPGKNGYNRFFETPIDVNR